MKKTTLSVFLALAMIPGAVLPGESHSENPSSKQPETITVVMEDCKVAGPQGFKGGGFVATQLVKRGTLQVDGQKYTFYLPEAPSYSIRNTNKNDNDYDNTSTPILIDQDGDGKLEKHEKWHTNLPVRMGDRMFDTVEISEKGDRIVLKPSRASLCGSVIGRRCPSFSFKTADGREITLESLADKVFVMDVWSVT